MKNALLIIITTFALSVHSTAQTKTNKTTSDYISVPGIGGTVKFNKSKLKTGNEGFPVYLNVLRLNDTTILDITCIDSYKGIVWNEDENIDKIALLGVTSSTIFKFNKTCVSAEQMIELVSSYSFKLSKDGFLYKEFIKDGNGAIVGKLPKYLTITLETLNIK